MRKFCCFDINRDIQTSFAFLKEIMGEWNGDELLSVPKHPIPKATLMNTKQISIIRKRFI